MPNSILTNGHRTLITIQGITPQFEEVSVTPPGIKADDPIEQSNMRSVNYRTFQGGALMTLSEMTVKVNYAVGAFSLLLPFIRQNRYVTITFFDGSSISLYCIITSFTPEETQTNEKPTATLVLTPSMLTTSDPPTATGITYATVAATTTVAP